ncbi:DUF3352 domain-containing protein [Fulvivirga sp. RKSG066]|nr:DUF3352 domain-containing protein [Fulvivirga aurantia]
MKDNETLWEMVMARPMLISMHEVRRDEYDFLYVADLQKATKLQFIKNYIDKLTDKGTQVYTRDFHGSEITELAFEGSTTRLYLTINDNLLAFSTTHTLIENSIDQLAEPKIARDLDFIDINKQMGGEDNIGVYLQHKFFLKYIDQWLTEEESVMLDFLNSTKYTGTALSTDDAFLQLEGNSNILDSIPTLLGALQRSGEGEIRLPIIAPENTSFFMTFGFDDAEKFYKNLEATITEPDYKSNKEKLEKFLNISLEKDFLSWIDDEIGIIQLHAEANTRAAEFAVAIRHNDKEDATERLEYIKNQIKKKTPVKFRGIEYKGHQIHFLSVKGFFKIMFGKAFSKIDKPYYTVLDDYVVFSNTPKTLGKIINHYSSGSTLNNNKAFADHMDRFDTKASVFMYINAEQFITDSEKILTNEYWQVVKENKTYFESFPMAGVQFKPNDNLLGHTIVVEFAGRKKSADLTNLFAIDTPAEEEVLKEENDDESIAIDDILPDDLTDKTMDDYYANGQLKYEVSLKNGKKHGRYFEYDSAGNVIVKGRFRNDQKSGTWKFYDAEGDVVRKERF